MKKEKIILILCVLAVVFAIGAVIYQRNLPGALDDFAVCLKDKGVTFYGAFWCPHCQAQKALFGNSAKKLPYVECSTPDSQGQLKVCGDKKIVSYPTWEFADGSRETGEVLLAKLSEKSGCVLPK